MRYPATPQRIPRTPAFANPGTPTFAADFLSVDEEEAAFGVEDADDEEDETK